MLIVWETPILDDIETIVRALRTEIQSEGIGLLKDISNVGTDLMVTCPIHKDGMERKPSCGISLSDVTRNNKTYPAGTVHCFTCGYTAEFPVFISDVLGYKDEGYRGFKWLVSNFVSLEIEKRNLNIKIDRASKQKKKKQYISEEELDSYRYTHPYMYKRKLTDPVIEFFDVGYDSKKDAITFPVYDLEGKVPFIQKRAVKQKKFFNPPNEDKDFIYGLYQLNKAKKEYKRIWITESIIDALTCWVHGEAGLALLGMPTAEQIELLKQLPHRRIILALDNDSAGRKGKIKLYKALKGKLFYEPQFPKGTKDINDLTAEQFHNLKINLVLG